MIIFTLFHIPLIATLSKVPVAVCIDRYRWYRVFCYWTVVASGSGLYTCNNEKPLKLQVKIKKNAITGK